MTLHAGVVTTGSGPASCNPRDRSFLIFSPARASSARNTLDGDVLKLRHPNMFFDNHIGTCRLVRITSDFGNPPSADLRKSINGHPVSSADDPAA